MNQVGTGAVSLSSSAQEEHDTQAPATGESLEVSAETGSEIKITLTANGTILFAGSGASVSVPVLREFFDYDCEYCREHALSERPWIDAEFVSVRKISVERVFVPITKWGERLALASLCAFDQMRFKELNHLLLTKPTGTEAELLLRAKEAGLKQPAFSQCLKRGKMPSVSAVFPDGTAVERVPAFAIGNTFWLGVEQRESVQRYLEKELR